MRALVTEIEAEVNRLIVHVNDEVVPEVRRGSSRGLRMVAEQLGRLAAQLDSTAASEASAGRAPASPAGRTTNRTTTPTTTPTGDWL